MVDEVTEAVDPDLDYLRACLEAAPFRPYPWDGEDRNIGAFRSKEELVAWYCQPPGIDGQPYRDRAFYTRELAYLSRITRPRTVVEFGTCQGIGTCLLRWLNPTARLITVDKNQWTYMPGDQRVPMGHLAKWQDIRCEFVRGEAHNFFLSGQVDLCFIDGDHSYVHVLDDSNRAWDNRSRDHDWTIVWHDYNNRHLGVMMAVHEFCKQTSYPLQSRPDSDTVWIMGKD